MITLDNVVKKFDGKAIIEQLTLSVSPGSVTCILGSSGCGKTTLLNLIAGLVQPDSGRVDVRGRLSCVFQEARLLPWASVAENAEYAMNPRINRQERREKRNRMLEMLELKDASSLLPGQISGGMARRTALARGLLAPSEVLLLDEPFSSLDPELRSRIIKILPEIIKEKAVVLVTHDYAVAEVLSDRVFLLSKPPGKLRTVDKNDIEGTLRQINREREE